jgi:hypothetical protein
MMNEDDPVQEQGWVGFSDAIMVAGDVDGVEIELIYVGE